MKKLIKVTSRGIVLTSRGKCRTPFITPVWEDVDIIFQMISAQRATVIEVLNNGEEVTLTPFNFDKDNSNGSSASSMSKPNPPVLGKVNDKKNKKNNKVTTPVTPEPVKPEVTPAEEVKEIVKEELAETPTPEPTPEVVAPVEEVTEEVVEEVTEEAAPIIDTSKMSRKERKKYEYELKKKAEQKEANDDTNVENSEVPADAIEE